MAGRILVIRGGAIGDFILTLPAISLLREAFPDAHIEILGYPHITAVADGRHYADATQSIESSRLAGFFNPKADLDPDLCEYFAGFQQVISYLFDPDGFFAGNLRRAGVRNLIEGNPKIGDHTHAAAQLAAPLEGLALFLESNAARIHPSVADREAATALIPDSQSPPVAIHPGSGGARKNWPVDRWIELARHLTRGGLPLVVVGGESDGEQLPRLRTELQGADVRWAEHLPLPVLGAVFERCRLFVGHDSGISHLAAAAGTNCVLLFGPTDPSVWAPENPGVHIVKSKTEDMRDIPLESVREIVDSLSSDV